MPYMPNSSEGPFPKIAGKGPGEVGVSLKKIFFLSCGDNLLPLHRMQDLFHVYLNRFEFYFLGLHVIKRNKFCLFVHNECVPGIAN